MSDDLAGGPQVPPADPPAEQPAWRRAATVIGAVVLAGVLVAVFAWTQLRDDDDRGPTAGGPIVPTTSTVPAPVASSTPTISTRDLDGAGPAAPSPSVSRQTGSDADQSEIPPGWQEAAEGFGRAFTDKSGGQPAWFARVSQFLTPQKAAQYQQVPIEQIPDGKFVRAEAKNPAGMSSSAMLYYDTGLVVLVSLANNGSQWQVATIERVGSNASPDA
jgi:hypothetical protein